MTTNQLEKDRAGFDRWITPARTARLLGLTRNTIYQLIRRQEIPAVKIGGRQFVDAVALMRRMESSVASDHTITSWAFDPPRRRQDLLN